MKKFISIITILLSLGIFQGFSNDIFEITVLTCSPGKETYSAWGHTAIRIIDKRANIDVVYNFGLFDFNTPNFYPKFIKGRLKYKLGIQHTHQFYQSYLRENRQIIEQKLNLSREEKTAIIQKLQYLYKPENRYYLYRFAGKNCTTEIRDLILENVETDFKSVPTDKTIRDQLNDYLQDRLWLRFSMSLIMGYKIDREIDKFDSMFLPDYLCYGLRDINTNHGELVKEESIFNQLYKTTKNLPFFLNPLVVFSILFLLILIIKRNYIQIPVVVFIGITGLVILVLSIITEHPELRSNLNFLWINPLLLLLVFAKKGSKLKKYIATTILVMAFTMIPIWLFKVQYFEWTYFPIYLIMILFNLRILFPNKKLSIL